MGLFECRGLERAAPAVRQPGKWRSRWNGEKVRRVRAAGAYIALAFCLVAAGVIGYYTLLRPQQPTTPGPATRYSSRVDRPQSAGADDADEPAALTMEPAPAGGSAAAGRLPALTGRP